MLRRTPPGPRSSVPAHRTHHTHRAKGCVVPCSTSVAAAEQGRSSSLAKRKVLLVASSVVQACLPGRAVSRNEQSDETAGCGLRGLETGRDGAGSSKLGRDGPWRPRAVLSGARWRSAVQEYVERYTRGVPGGFAGHPQHYVNVYYTESDNIIIDRICLLWYWLILDISC